MLSSSGRFTCELPRACCNDSLLVGAEEMVESFFHEMDPDVVLSTFLSFQWPIQIQFAIGEAERDLEREKIQFMEDGGAADRQGFRWSSRVRRVLSGAA